MYLSVGLALLAMAAAFVVAKLLKLKTELALLAMTLVGLLFSGNGVSLRHLAEGSIAYLDMCLIFITATLFMNIVKAAGGVDYLVRRILIRFHKNRVVLLIILMFLMLIPGALTGAGSVSVLVVGGTMALVLKGLGVEDDRAAAAIFLLAGLSAAAPPVNIWAMITTAGTAIPYVGFEVPLGIPVLLLGLFVTFYYGMRGKPRDLQSVLATIPEAPEKMRGWRVGVPFLVVVAFIVAPRIWPFDLPVLGLPIGFTAAALAAWMLSPRRLNIVRVAADTMDQLLPLLSTVVIIGMLMQVMSANGTRGLMSLAIISLPVAAVFCLLPFVMPFSEGVFTFGASAVFGIPLIWTLNSVGHHPVIALSGLSLLWMLGDALPPTALIGRLSVQTTGFGGPYRQMLKSTWLPWIVITALGTMMVVLSRQLSFLVV